MSHNISFICYNFLRSICNKNEKICELEAELFRPTNDQVKDMEWLDMKYYGVLFQNQSFYDLLH